MKAVIVAVGMGTRMDCLENRMQKCLIKVGKKTLIERSVDCLNRNKIKDISVVVGYKKEDVISNLKHRVEYIFNPFYKTTNNMASLWFAKSFVNNEDFLYLHGDLLYHPAILKKCLNHKEKTVLMVDKKKCGKEEMKYLSNKGYLVESSKNIDVKKAEGEWIGINKFSSEVGKKLFQEIDKILYSGNFGAYDTLALTRMARKRIKLPVCGVGGLPWIEIDFPEDLKKARTKVYPKIKESNTI